MKTCLTFLLLLLASVGFSQEKNTLNQTKSELAHLKTLFEFLKDLPSNALNIEYEIIGNVQKTSVTASCKGSTLCENACVILKGVDPGSKLYIDVKYETENGNHRITKILTQAIKVLE